MDLLEIKHSQLVGQAAVRKIWVQGLSQCFVSHLEITSQRLLRKTIEEFLSKINGRALEAALLHSFEGLESFELWTNKDKDRVNSSCFGQRPACLYNGVATLAILNQFGSHSDNRQLIFMSK